jgi:hypothetical protein
MYMDQHAPIAITEGLRRRGVDVLTAHEDAPLPARWIAKSKATAPRQVSSWKYLSARAILPLPA